MAQRDRNLGWFKKEVAKIDSGLKEGTDNFNTALFMLVTIQVGPNIKKLAKFTGIPRPFIAERARRLRRNNLWRGSKIVAGGWFKESGGIAFACDCLVAEGLLKTG